MDWGKGCVFEFLHPSVLVDRKAVHAAAIWIPYFPTGIFDG
jgi:hypothetical protein